LLKRPVGRPSNEVRRSHASFTYQAGSWSKPRRVIARKLFAEDTSTITLSSVSERSSCFAMKDLKSPLSGWPSSDCSGLTHVTAMSLCPGYLGALA
jgi:hypothetical protein